MDLIEAKALTANRHPWERARASFFIPQLLRAVGTDGPRRVLDVGCGDGWFARRFLSRLPAGSELVGWDIALDDERLGIFSADLPEGMTLTNADPAGDFDLILCMDVAEHVPDDHAFLADLTGRFLRPGGYLLVSVPAWPGLFSAHDLALRHYRRYTPRMGRALVESAGLEVVRKGGLFHGLAGVRALQVARSGRAEPLEDPATHPESEDAVGLGRWDAPAPVTALVTLALQAEGLLSAAAAAARLELPGLSWWVLGRKP